MLRIILLALCVSLLSCQPEIVEAIYTPRNDHEAYAWRLAEVGLDNSSLGREWLKASTTAFAQPITITAPAEEGFYFSDREASSLCYSFEVRRGEEITISISQLNDATSDTASLPLFVDLFRSDTTENMNRILVASYDRPSGTLEFEPRHDATYLLRIQHELLSGGRFSMRIERGPRLSFPVQGGRNYDIGSFFGDPRDGGRRLHHGVDIFAKRHTPIIAPCDGHVRFAGEKGLGGKVVWMRNEEQQITLYFAHLHTIMAQDGMEVKAGDTLGTCGNTGNARTTPPHLHFGIYANGPIDPYPFVAFQKRRLKPMLKDHDAMGSTYRTKHRCRFLDANDDQRYLSADQLVTTIGLNDKFIRVRLPDGSDGRIRLEDLETLDTPLDHELPGAFELRESPDNKSTTIANYHAADDHKVYAVSDQHLFVRAADGREGWTSSP